MPLAVEVNVEQVRNRLRLFRTQFLVAVCLTTLVGIVFGLVYYASFPYTGIEYSNPTTLIGHVDPEGPAARAGIRSGDRVLAVNGKPRVTGSDPYLSPGEAQAVFTVQRGGDTLEVMLTFESSLVAGVLRKLTFYIVAFGFWVTGTLLLVLRTRDERITLLILCCLITADVMSVLPIADLGVSWANRVVPFLLMLLCPFFVHFHSVFPERKPLKRRWALVVATTYAIGFALLFARLSVSAAFLPSLIAPLNLLMRAFIAVTMLFGLGLLMHTLRVTSSALVRRQASLMVLGTGLAVLAVVGLVVVPQMVSGAYFLPTYVAYAALLLIPISYAYTTYRHRLLAIDPQINRAVVYAALAVAVVGAYSILWEPMTAVIRSLLPGADTKIAGLLTAIPIAFSVAPLRAQIQRWVDTAFYGGWYDFRTLVADSAQKLNRISDLQALVDRLVADLAAQMRVQSVAVIVRDETGGDYTVRKAIGFEGRFQRDARIRPSSPLAAFLAHHHAPITQPQLESALGADAQLELWPWSGAQVWVPIVKEGILQGIVVLGLKEMEDFFDKEDLLILNTLAEQAAVVILNVRLIETLRRRMEEINRLYIEVQRAREEEKLRIARDLHDSTIQDLIGLTYRLETSQLPQLVVEGVRDDLQEAIRGLRDICSELHPPVLEELGLVAALHEYVNGFRERHEIEVSLHVGDGHDRESLPVEVELGMFRILQESLSNVARHSHAKAATVDLTIGDDAVTLQVADNGVGFEVPERLGQLTRTNHFGLAGIQQRVSALGGDIQIESEPGLGTRLTVRVPLRITRRSEQAIAGMARPT